MELQVLRQTGAVASAATSFDIDVHSVCGLCGNKKSKSEKVSFPYNLPGQSLRFGRMLENHTSVFPKILLKTMTH